VGTTDNSTDAFEALVAEASETNKKFENYEKDNNFLILALGDADEISIPPNWREIDIVPNMPTAQGPRASAWGFYGRIMGTESPHRSLPLPCFDFVREKWGEAWRTKSPAGQEVPGALTSQGKGYDKDQIEQQAADFNQDLVEGHTYFVIPKHKADQRPVLGDIWTAILKKGSEWNGAYSLTSGEAKELRSKDILKIENWEKASGPKKEFYYTPTKESCATLEDLFEEKAVESGQIEECGELCCIEADDWHTFEKTDHPVWQVLGPNDGEFRLKAKPCPGYVVLGDNFPDLTDVVMKEIDWWACGDVKKAWGSGRDKMDSATLDEFDEKPAGFWDPTRKDKCSSKFRLEPYDSEAQGHLSDKIAAEQAWERDWLGNEDYKFPEAAAEEIPYYFASQLEIDRIQQYFEATYLRFRSSLRTDESAAAIKDEKSRASAYGFVPERWVLEKENAWSAATISWLLLQVDSDFPAALGHTDYVFRALGLNRYSSPLATSKIYSPAKHGWTVWLRGTKDPRIVAQIGDILWKPTTYCKTCSHSDVVSRIATHNGTTYAYLAGGNVSSTMKGWTTTMRIALTSTGTYPVAISRTDYQIVLKKNGRIVPETDQKVATAVSDPKAKLTIA